MALKAEDYPPCATCGHASEEHSDGGPAHTGYTRCEYNVNDWGATGCEEFCMEYLPDPDKCEHSFTSDSLYCDYCDFEDRDQIYTQVPSDA